MVGGTIELIEILASVNARNSGDDKRRASNRRTFSETFSNIPSAHTLVLVFLFRSTMSNIEPEYWIHSTYGA